MHILVERRDAARQFEDECWVEGILGLGVALPPGALHVALGQCRYNVEYGGPYAVCLASSSF